MTGKELQDCMGIAVFKSQRKYFPSNLHVMYILNARTGKYEWLLSNNQFLFSVGGPWYEIWIPRKYHSDERALIMFFRNTFESKIKRLTREERMIIARKEVEYANIKKCL